MPPFDPRQIIIEATVMNHVSTFIAAFLIALLAYKVKRGKMFLMRTHRRKHFPLTVIINRQHRGRMSLIGHIGFEASSQAAQQLSTSRSRYLVSISHSVLPSNTNKMKLAIAALLAGSAAAFAPSQQGARSATQLHETKVRVESV